MKFKDLPIRATFRFVPRPNAFPTEAMEANAHVYCKVSARKYQCVLIDGSLEFQELQVGSINVEVEEARA